MIREPDTVVVRPVPDREPVEFPWPRGVRASWITDEIVREMEES
ncbi:hypothetical protein [Streptomyces sp. NPDC002491]